MPRVLLSLGSNLGDSLHRLSDALAALEAIVTLTGVSSIYRSAAVGFEDQPDFLNLVCAGRTQLSPRRLLSTIQEIERALGRAPSFRNGPREIDIDILDYEERLTTGVELEIPHPRMSGRAFVLVPLAEIAPGWVHPRLGATARELLAATGPLERIERIGPPPPFGSSFVARPSS